ncbi:NAD-dependent epimerase/dehydratase family protein [Rhodococcus pseudokoreensis]|uniref:NAD-dependent epimerase/dehydratase family protein n=1 Tax=Rhodococcus pseudokoreensis TaxID=2811421 RepID=A0A974ZVY7_9NOCA|nr:NAD-dependent epimerase/dehydratase family protein [Rhodococcus pseudokoreensis]QSE92466.1 NAD-dependent epimerase/dehydratase family protein [Rhodococcus pseudokoreensis]
MTATIPRPAPALPGKVFITGANGFIGAALARRMRALGVEVTGVDLTADPANGIVAGNTTDPDSWSAALHGVDVVIHTAALVSNVASLEDAWTVNVLGTRRVLDAAIGAGVRRFVHLSSIAAYGFAYPDGVDEKYPVHVNGHSYTDTKVNSEAVVLTAHAAGEIDCTVIRPGDVYGPESRPWVILILQMLAARQLILPNGGKGTFTPVYIDNLVDGILLAIASDAAAGQIFNITDGDGMSCAQYFGRLARMTGGPVRTLPAGLAIALASTVGAIQRRLGRPSELSPGTMLMLNRPGAYSIDKARTVLGYEPLVSFDEGMTRVEAWAREEGLIPA